ncbi:MAG: hypothetical protein KBC81_02655 [Candidatus Pacebacteria bacterium]|nr:hypothetical protein [Candidatus Paceibacterota bacterium]
MLCLIMLRRRSIIFLWTYFLDEWGGLEMYPVHPVVIVLVGVAVAVALLVVGVMKTNSKDKPSEMGLGHIPARKDDDEAGK